MKKKRSTEKINTVKSWFFENIYIKLKTLKLLAMLGKKQANKGHNSPISENKWVVINTDSMNIKRVKGNIIINPNAHKFDKLNVMDQILETHNKNSYRDK